MKVKITLLLLFVSALGFAQLKIDSIGKTVTYTKIHEVGFTKKKIAEKTAEWFAKTFNDSKAVIKLNTEDKIIGKGIFNSTIYSNGTALYPDVHFILNVEFKENRFKIEFEDYILHFTDSNIDQPMSSYFVGGDLEWYKNLIIEYYQDKPNDYVKKQVLKRLKNPKKVAKDYNERVLLWNSVKESVLSNSERLSKNLLEYIKKEADKDGW